MLQDKLLFMRKMIYGRLRPYLNKVIVAEQGGICSTEFHVMRVIDRTSVLSEYVAAILRSDLILAQTKHMMTGNTHPRISNDDVKNLSLLRRKRYRNDEAARSPKAGTHSLVVVSTRHTKTDAANQLRRVGSFRFTELQRCCPSILRRQRLQQILQQLERRKSEPF